MQDTTMLPQAATAFHQKSSTSDPMQQPLHKHNIPQKQLCQYLLQLCRASHISHPACRTTGCHQSAAFKSTNPCFSTGHSTLSKELMLPLPPVTADSSAVAPLAATTHVIQCKLCIPFLHNNEYLICNSSQPLLNHGEYLQTMSRCTTFSYPCIHCIEAAMLGQGTLHAPCLNCLVHECLLLIAIPALHCMARS